ncbi:MAG TPA: hypothetical protein VLH13_01580, partial [Methanomassiliicoccales archaeon]|nr:hypothetical protein [Methanomassiliicoccales archaeon]
MVDPKKAYAKMREVGLLGFVDLYVKDQLDKETVLSCSVGTQMLLSYVIDKIGRMRNGVGVFVTHDMIITPPLAYYFGYDFQGKGLAAFLEGIVLYEAEDGYLAQHDGISVKVDRAGNVLPGHL